MQALIRRPLWLMATAWATLLAACGSSPTPPLNDNTPAAVESPGPADSPPGSVGARTVSPASAASTPKAYRQDAAQHLYKLNAQRIYAGKLPPMLYAVGVLQVSIDSRGQVTQLHWMRAPRHAPEVIAEIERTAREAAPYPVPTRLGKVVYTDTWLWDQSGKFQLDTLTEGQSGG
jgi:hypothetical protein